MEPEEDEAEKAGPPGPPPKKPDSSSKKDKLFLPRIAIGEKNKITDIFWEAIESSNNDELVASVSNLVRFAKISPSYQTVIEDLIKEYSVSGDAEDQLKMVQIEKLFADMMKKK